MSFGLAELQEIWEAIPEDLRKNAVIAGGAVRDALIGRKPDDIDIFVFGKISEYVFEEYCRLFDATEWKVDNSYTQDMETDIVFAEAEFREHKVQIIEAKSFGKSVEDLVAGFDWNICKFAYNNDGLKMFDDPANLHPGGTLRVGAVKRQQIDRSFKRGKEFAARYHLHLPYGEIRKLVRPQFLHNRKRRDEMKEWEFKWAARAANSFLDEIAALF